MWNDPLTIDGLSVDVSCATYPLHTDGCWYLDRFVTCTAEVTRPPSSEVLARVSVEVVYRFHLNSPPVVEARQWVTDADAPVTRWTGTTRETQGGNWGGWRRWT